MKSSSGLQSKEANFSKEARAKFCIASIVAHKAFVGPQSSSMVASNLHRIVSIKLKLEVQLRLQMQLKPTLAEQTQKKSLSRDEFISAACFLN